MGRLTKYTLADLIFLLLVLCSCQDKEGSKRISSEYSSPLLITKDTTIIHLDEYFPTFDSIQEIAVLDGYTYEEISFNTIELVAPGITPSLSKIECQDNDVKKVLILKAIASEKVNFKYWPKIKTVKKVYLAGDFNEWNYVSNPLIFNGQYWELKIRIPFGQYNYKFVVDGKWLTDPANPDSVNNNIGGYNSVINIGNNQGKIPVIKTQNFTNNSIIFSTTNTNKILALWQDIELTVFSTEEGEIINIPKQAQGYERSFIRIFGANQDCFSNDILIPLSDGSVIDDPGLLTRKDKQTLQLYNVFVDRFFDGDSTNDRPLNSPEVNPRADYHGGDLAGIIKKIDQGYFTNLGINTLWISPIVQNPDSAYGFYPNPPTKFSAYHGYWPISYTKIDKRFGTDSVFTELVTHAHNNNLNVLLDFVANHVHELHPVYQQHPEWATNLYLPGGSLNTERWDDHRLTTWFDTFLPTMDHSIPEVTEMISDSAVYWYNKFKIDGFRHDATKHVPDVFWQTLTKKIKQQKKINDMFYQIGETYGSPELIGGYVNSSELDGQFDFNVYDAEVNVFANDKYDFSHLDRVIEQSLNFYGSHHLMGNISGNQDRARFISYADGSISFDEDAKLAGWTREIKVHDTLAYYKMAMLMAVNFTIPGVPVIFYGDEIGMPGGNDPDCRRMMKFSELNLIEQNLYDKVKKLSHIRSHSMPLLFGDYKVIELTEKTFVYVRSYFNQTVVVAFNNQDERSEISVKIPADISNKKIKNHFDQKFKRSGNQLKIDINPFSFEIISIH